jgi:hypothetical protein
MADTLTPARTNVVIVQQSPGKTDRNLIVVNPARVCRSLLIVAGSLITIHLTGVIVTFSALGQSVFSRNLIRFFDVSLETNIPALFSTLLLGFAAVLLFVIYRFSLIPAGKPFQKQWLLLSMVFVFLMTDEATQIHEHFNNLSIHTGNAGGFLYYAWVIPYALLAIFTGIYFLPFLRSLSPSFRNWFLCSGCIYVTAAIGFEIPEGRLTLLYGAGSLPDKLLCALEELLEMTSVILFIFTLLRYLAEHCPGIRIDSGR